MRQEGNQKSEQLSAPKGSAAKRGLSRSIVLLGALIFLKGEVDFFQQHFGPGSIASVLGAVLVAAGFILPLVPWHRFKDILAEFKDLIPKRLPRVPRTASVGLERKLPLQPQEPKLPWMPFAQDRLVLSRNWFLLPLGLLALHTDWSISQGKIVVSILEMAVGLILGWVYLSNFSRPLIVPNMNRNFKTSLMLLAPFFLLELPGVWILYRYVYVMTGYFVVLAGGSWMLAILARRPLNFVDDEAATSRDTRWFPSSAFFDASPFAIKSSLVAGAALCAFLAMEVFSGRQPTLSVVFGFLGMALLFLSFPWLPDGLAGWEKISPAKRGGISLAMAGIAFLIGVRAQDLLEQGQHVAGLWHFLAAGILLVLGLSHYGKRSDPGDKEDGGAWVKRLEILAVLLLVFAAFQFRAYKVGIFPYGAEGDEAGGGVWAVDVLKGIYDNPLVSANVPLHFFSVTAIFFKLFGIHLWTLRAHSVFFGTISVAATFFFLRFFFGPAVSFLATALMSFSYWHLHFSRFGHYNIEQVALQIVAFYFVFRGMRSGKAWSWIVGGLAFGLAMQPHLASRLLPFQGIALLLYFFIARRDLLRRNFGGFLMFVIAAWMAAAPSLVYWLSRPVSMGRVQSVSIFDRTNSNAPPDVLQGFVRNCKVSAMMFNESSDTRTRDNPLAPQKILEFWSSILYALAFMYLLYHWRDSLSFLLLSAFFINLAASIFSVEAPQTLRTAGNIPLVFAFMAFLFYDVRESFCLLGKNAGKALFLLIMVPSVAFFCYRSWYKLFVEAGNLTFDATPTYIAEIAGEQGTDKDQAVFFASGFASSHPPVILFAQNTPIRNFYTLSDYLPITLAAGKRHLLFFCDSFESLTPWAESLYPSSKVVPIPQVTAPGQDLASYMIVSEAEIASHQGLSAEVDGKNHVDHASLQYPSPEIPAAKHIRWKGSVRFENYGFYTFAASGDGDCTVLLAGQVAYRRVGRAVQAPRLALPLGMVPIEVDYSPRNTQSFLVRWGAIPHPARLLYSFQQPTNGELDKRVLLDFPIHGLFGQYYTSSTFKGDAVMEYVEPTVLSHWLDSPLPGNWCAVWKGKITAPVSGIYNFRVATLGSFAEIFIDGKRIARTGQDPLVQMVPPKVEAPPYLKAGEHTIEMHFFTTGASWYELRWMVPGQGETQVLPKYLTPTYPHL